MTRTTEAQAEGRKPRTDEELLAAVRDQRPDAFPDLRDRHWHTAVVVARLHSPSRQDAEQLAGTGFDQLLAEVGTEVDGADGAADSRGEGQGVFLRARLVAIVGRAGTDGEPAAEQVSGIYLGLPASWQAVLWYLEIEGLDLDRTAAVLGLSPAATTALHLEARAGLRAAYRQARLDLPGLPGCADCAADLGALADGRLPAERAQAVQAHLDECPRCTADHLYLQDTGKGLRTWLLPVLAGVPLWDTRTDELVELVRTAGRMSAGRLSAARGTDVAGGALAAVHVSRGGRKVLLGAGVLAAAAALAGVAVTGGLGDGTTQATSRGGGSGATDSPAPAPVGSSETSDDGAMLARGAGAGTAPGGDGGRLSLPTLEPSPGPLTESAAEARRAGADSGTILTAGTAGTAGTAEGTDGSATGAREAGAGSASAADRRPGADPRTEGSRPDDGRAPRSAASNAAPSEADSSAGESSGGGGTGRGTAAAGGGGSSAGPSEDSGGTGVQGSPDEAPASEAPVVETPAPPAPAEGTSAPPAPAEEASASPAPAEEAPASPAPVQETPAAPAPAQETSAPPAGTSGTSGTSPSPGPGV